MLCKYTIAHKCKAILLYCFCRCLFVLFLFNVCVREPHIMLQLNIILESVMIFQTYFQEKVLNCCNARLYISWDEEKEMP